MANREHLEILKQGVDIWNDWRKASNYEAEPALSEADLSRINLRGVNLSGANLREANLVLADLRGADLSAAYLREADLKGTYLNGTDMSNSDMIRANLRAAQLTDATLFKANLSGATLFKTNLSGANLSEANLSGANLYETNLSGANLSEANLSRTSLIATNLKGADLANCRIYGISAWDIELEGAKQNSLIITPPNQPAITVDNLQVAQFVYLILNNSEIRNVIDTIGKKGVLILGRFKEAERKEVLDAIREELHRLDYVPIVFDFKKPSGRDFTETILTLAGMCRFIIADLTNPKSTPLELQAIIPNYMIPFAPIIQRENKLFAMFSDLHNKYHWVLEPFEYDSVPNLVKVLDVAVIKPALKKHEELMLKKLEGLQVRKIEDYL